MLGLQLKESPLYLDCTGLHMSPSICAPALFCQSINAGGQRTSLYKELFTIPFYNIR